MIKDNNDYELIKTIHTEDGSIINIYQPKMNMTEDERRIMQKNFCDFLADLIFRSYLLSKKAESDKRSDNN